MNKPSTLQKRVLRAITEEAMAARKLLAHTESDTGRRMDGARSPAHHRQVLKIRELEAAAVAGGVPREWIDQTRYRGELGMTWRADLHWREHAPIDRPQLLTNLGNEVRQVREIAAVAAAYGQRGALAEAGTSQLFARNFDTQVRRVAAIAHILNLSADETEHLWGRESHWAAEANRVREMSAAALKDRWRTVARADTRSAAVLVSALTDAGIGAEMAGNPAPSAAHMVQRIWQQLREPTSPAVVTGSSPGDLRAEFSAVEGNQIAESVDAAGLGGNLRPVFRSPADPDPSPPTGVGLGGLEP
ncbi:hypothetical protein K7711_19205 [Nocardia sp. CA2R105]|uniref:hypothetical protein n=1 Tax=Nocardia coffeae TaxID=2873381 RepID=UPI001CA62FCE|nr:hypothetical protein [Nocardia coffeae]MBY8858615.1 hypothetical protein [Nocardia coffeae]